MKALMQIDIIKELVLLIRENQKNGNSLTRQAQIDSMFILLQEKMKEIDIDELKEDYLHTQHTNKIEKENTRLYINILSLGQAVLIEKFLPRDGKINIYNINNYTKEIIEMFKGIKSTSSSKQVQKSLLEEELEQVQLSLV